MQSFSTSHDSAELRLNCCPKSSHDRVRFPDPIVQKLLCGEAGTVSEAEEQYLDENLPHVIELVKSSLTDEEFRAHPLIVLLLSHGSRDWEDSVL